MKQNFFLALTLLISLSVKAEIQNRVSGNIDANLLYYTHDTKENPGHKHFLSLKNELTFSEKFSLTNEVRSLYFSYYKDQRYPENLNSDNVELYLGENYFKADFDPLFIQLGYQEVSWGEAFGMHFADIITPVDQRFTNYYDYSNSKIPTFLLNAKYLYNSGSVQFIYSPEVKFSKSLPIEQFLPRDLNSVGTKIYRQKDYDFFEKNNLGFKVSHSFTSLDVSYFYYNYIDPQSYYSLKGIDSNFTILVDEKHNRIQTHAINFAKSINDEYVLRSDVVYHKNKRFNTFASYNLDSYQSDTLEWLMSLDLPTWRDFSSTLIFAQSSILDVKPDTLRDEHERYAILKISYDLKESRTIDVAYTKELSKSSNFLITGINWNYSDNLDLKASYQSFWGKNGKLPLLKKTSALEFGIKYFF